MNPQCFKCERPARSAGDGWYGIYCDHHHYESEAAVYGKDVDPEVDCMCNACMTMREDWKASQPRCDVLVYLPVAQSCGEPAVTSYSPSVDAVNSYYCSGHGNLNPLN
jgi:hypothetical protein